VAAVNSDIIVVGGGPTGAFSALQATKLGAEVTVYEEHDRESAPSHCTGHVSLTGMKRLGLQLPKGLIENEIKSASFHSPSGYKFSVRFPASMSCVINRVLFDQWLLGKAVEAGARVFHSVRVNSLLIREGSIKGAVVRRDGEFREIASRVVVDAEGVSCSLVKQAGLLPAHRRLIVKGIHAEVDGVQGVDEDTVEVFLSRSLAPGFFAWIVPRCDGTAKIGLGTENGNPRDCLHNFINHNPIASPKLKRSHITCETYHPIPLGGPISKTFHDGLLIVGDAASQVKPTTGGGLIMGLSCAKIAGEVAAQAVQRGNSSDFLAEYERRWKKKIGFEMKIMRWVRLILNRLGDRKLDQLIALCTRLTLDDTLVKVRDIDFQGTSLIQIATSPRLMATGLYFLIASFL
jgi:digeranylgeranylglycerophospholipid reductase